VCVGRGCSLSSANKKCGTGLKIGVIHSTSSIPKFKSRTVGLKSCQTTTTHSLIKTDWINYFFIYTQSITEIYKDECIFDWFGFSNANRHFQLINTLGWLVSGTSNHMPYTSDVSTHPDIPTPSVYFPAHTNSWLCDWSGERRSSC
jgi:hypothetical protein